MPHPTSIPAESSATRRRTSISLLASFCTLISIVSTVLVLLGSTNDSPIISSIYFLRIDVSNIIPRSFQNAVLVNSIAQTLGLRDFYQVGLWNYCEGYKGTGVTYCGPPQALYSFNPVKILLSQLLSGAEIAIPGGVVGALEMAKRVSHVMFGFYIVGISFLAVSLVVGLTNHPAVATIVSFFSALFTTAAAVVSTALFAEFRSVFEDRPDLNIRGDLGEAMFTLVWMAVGFSIASLVLHASTCCCGWRGRKGRDMADRQGLFYASRGSTRGRAEKLPEEAESQVGVAM